MATRIIFEDEIDEQTLTKPINHDINENLTIKHEDNNNITNEDELSSLDNNSVNSEPCNTHKNTTQRTNKIMLTDDSEINDDVDNCDSNSSNVLYLGSKKACNSNEGNNSQLVNREDTEITEGCLEIPVEVDIESNMGQDNNMGKASQSPIGKGNKVKAKKKPTELEMLGVDVKVDFEDSESKYDVFGDENQIFRKYKLRKIEQQVSYKEPTDWKPKRRDSSDDAPVSLICTICFIEFDSKIAIRLHMRSHNPKVIEYNCALCSQKFKTNADLIAHKSTHSSESFLCKQCKVAFSDHADYLQHKLIHLNKSHYKCPECGLDFSIKYKMHILTHFDKKVSSNTNPVFISCVECGKMCKSKKYFEYHMSTHTGVKKFQCHYCGRCFANNSQRKIHTRIHTGERPYTCDICGHKSVQLSDLHRHKVTHESERKYACDLCPKKYFHKDYLVKHMRSHTKKSLYECPECDFSTVNPGGLKVHVMFKHLSERPVECTICNKKFINNNQFKKHSRSKIHKRNMYGHVMKKEKAET